ncbi:MAG: cofactor-independent phosphoglycerate mutase [Syntrophomonadaceae bacterium]
MKYLVILADGMADYKINDLGGRTPLQYARTPNIDALAKDSRIGLVSTIPANFPPGSDVANLSVLGYDPSRYYSGRSPLEAVSMGVELAENDLALRCNLVTLSAENDYAAKTMIDYSSGEISSSDSGQIIKTLQESLNGSNFSFYPGISYRHLLVWKGGRGKDLHLTPPHDISDRVVGEYLPGGSDSQILLDLMQRSVPILVGHPVNIERVKAGLKPATSIWFWGEGHKPALTTFEKRYGLNGSVIAAVDLVKGLGLCAGLNPVVVPGATGGIETNFAGKARAALDELKRGQDIVYLHIESPDECGHQGSISKKVWSIEQIDSQVVGLVRQELDSLSDVRIMLLPDHPTPIAIKTHSREPVPYLVFDSRQPFAEGPDVYDEDAAQAGLHVKEGHQLMDLFIKGFPE